VLALALPFSEGKRNVITPNVTSTAATVNPAVKV